MPRIREYSQQFGVGSEVGGRRATPEDMGYGQQIQHFGDTIQAVAKTADDYARQSELSDAQIRMAEADQQWDMRVRDVRKTAQPGIPTSLQLQSEMSEYFSSLRGNYKYKEAQQYVSLHGQKMSNKVIESSMLFDADLAVKDKTVKLEKIFTAHSNATYSNPLEYDSRKSQLLDDASSGKGLYEMPDARGTIALGQSVDKAVNNMAFMAAQGMIENPALRGNFIGLVKQAKSPELIAAEKSFTKEQEEAVWNQHAFMVQAGASAKDQVAFLSSKMPWASFEFADKSGNVVRYDPPMQRSIDPENAPSYYRDLTAEQKDRVLREAIARDKQERSVSDHSIKRTMLDHEAELSRTGTISGQKIPDAAFTDPLDREKYHAMQKAAEITKSVINAPRDEQAALLEQLKPKPSNVPGAYDFQDKVYAQALRQVETANKERQEDPMLAAYQRKFSGSSPIEPLDQKHIGSPEALSQWVQQRFVHAQAVSNQTKEDFRLTMKQESSALNDYFSRLPVEPINNGPSVLSVLGTLRKDLGPERFRIFTKSVNSESTTFNYLGELLAAPESAMNYSKGISGNVGYDRDQVAAMVARGNKIMTQKFDSPEDKALFKATLPSHNDALKVFSDVVGKIEGGLPTTSMVQTATRIYVALQSQSNAAGDWSLEKKYPENQKLFAQAVEIAFGKPTKMGGTSVFRPFGVSDADFQYQVQQRVNDLGKPDLVNGTYGLIDLATGDGKHRYGIVKNGIATNDFIDLDAPVKDTIAREAKRMQGHIRQPERPTVRPLGAGMKPALTGAEQQQKIQKGINEFRADQ